VGGDLIISVGRLCGVLTVHLCTALSVRDRMPASLNKTQLKTQSFVLSVLVWTFQLTEDMIRFLPGGISPRLMVSGGLVPGASRLCPCECLGF